MTPSPLSFHQTVNFTLHVHIYPNFLMWITLVFFFIQSPELVARLKKLKAKQEKVEYERMVSNIDQKVVHNPETFLLEGKGRSRNIIVLTTWKSIYHIFSNNHLSAYSKFWLKGGAFLGKSGGLIILLYWFRCRQS